MKLSYLIKLLADHLHANGDVEVRLWRSGVGYQPVQRAWYYPEQKVVVVEDR